MEFKTVHGEVCTLKDALVQAHKKSPADLTGYIALTDSLLHLIRHSHSVSPTKGTKEV